MSAVSLRDLPNAVFDASHYASTLAQQLKRALQLGPKYYFWDLPRYFAHRRALRLPGWDLAAVWNPLREFRRRPDGALPLPPSYGEALGALRAAGVRLTMPRRRLEALVGSWWAVREVPGDEIECGAYRGATALLLAVLGKLHGVTRTTLMLDTFAGMPRTSAYDASRTRGEFTPPPNQVEVIRRQAAALGVADRVEVRPGLFAETFAALQPRALRFAFVHIDANIYQGTWEACDFTLPRMSAGGIVVFDDYNGVCDLGARLAIARACAGRRLAPPRPLAGSSASLRVGAPPAAPG
jgi:hypothetical protein